MNQPLEQLKLENQLCFPLYAGAKEIVRLYKPYLDPLGLTYTQYIAMMLLWECRSATLKELGERLWLDSGTLTPLVKKLEEKGYVTRSRDPRDERSLVVTLTPAGEALQLQAAHIPGAVGACVPLSPEEGAQIYSILYKMLFRLRRKEP